MPVIRKEKKMSQIHNITINKQRRSLVHLITDYWILIAPLILSGCMGVYEGGFECPPGKGLGCTSVSEVNDWVNQDQVNNCQISDEGKKACHKCSSSSDGTIWYSPWVTSSPNLYIQKSNVKLFNVQDSI